VYHVPLWLALGVIALALAVSVLASLVADRRESLPRHQEREPSARRRREAR
jgi:heme exporter protein D